MSEPNLHAAATDFLAHSSYHPCLLLVHPEIRRLTDASDELASTYGWHRLRMGRDLSAALLTIPPADRPRAAERVVASLRDWGVLVASERRTYSALRQAMEASSAELEAWLLACALRAHPAEELPFADLLRLPELFPFRFTLTVEALRTHPWLEVQRQGGGWDMVGVLV